MELPFWTGVLRSAAPLPLKSPLDPLRDTTGTGRRLELRLPAGRSAPHRAPWLYRGRGFLDHGITLAGSSDRPVADGSPLRAIQFMVERASEPGQVIGPDEGVTVGEALRAYTVAGAFACHWEDRAGSLTPGRSADLIVLGDDPTGVEVARIGDIDVVATFVDGRETEGGAL
ncbi:amidohydrolase family protein [Streptomyces sp. NPDC017991]|uniref:amidohydrolase family protein n=1 Tax=Streptomyces sp. NPDC017991 TaxID=3365026 RepID=UPI0037970669